MNNTPAEHPAPSTFSASLYRTLWRWHFYAGLFCIPFVLTLAVSGTIFLFKPQIENMIDAPFHNLNVEEKRASPNEMIQAALTAIPGADFLSFQLPKSETHAVIVSVRHNTERVLVYINPYSLEVLKTIAHNKQFIQIVRTFHGELLAGKFGSVIIELAGCWAIFLIITGIYLWWPRTSKKFAGIIYPRLKAGGRSFWRDLHVVSGFWVSGFTLFLLISGLPWSLVWGSAFTQFRELSSPQVEQQSWTLSREQEEMLLMPVPGGDIDLSLDLLASAHALHLADPVELAVSKNEPGIWTLKSQHQNRRLRAEAKLMHQTGQLLELKTFEDKASLDKVIGTAISAHEGQLFGWFNQLLGALITVALFIISVSGFILWRKRKPSVGLGAPSKLPNISASRVAGTIAVTLAIFLPLLAISLVIILVLEYLFRHVNLRFA